MPDPIPKSSQDLIGKCLSEWRNARVASEIVPPFLDIACGDNILVRKLKGGIGVDIMNYGRTDVIVESFCDLPFAGQTFSSVAIVGSLNYFDHPKKVLSECARLLKPHGKVLLTLLNPIIGKLWHRIREPWVKYPGFSFRELENMIRGTNLRITKRARFMLGMNNLYILTKT